MIVKSTVPYRDRVSAAISIKAFEISAVTVPFVVSLAAVFSVGLVVPSEEDNYLLTQFVSHLQNHVNNLESSHKKCCTLISCNSNQVDHDSHKRYIGDPVFSSIYMYLRINSVYIII